ncbi:hypothetical protein Ac2012v2_003932, partial [Leucoagaricus gongylophorus]
NESKFIFRALFYSTAAAPEAFRRHHHHPDVLACGGIKNRGVSRDTDISMTTKIQKFSGISPEPSLSLRWLLDHNMVSFWWWTPRKGVARSLLLVVTSLEGEPRPSTLIAG